MNLLKKAWTEGIFPALDYFHMQFLFSSGTILALSALLQNSGSANDREDFLLSCSFLQQLERNGSYGAKEFCAHADVLKAALQENLDTISASEIVSGPVGDAMSLAGATYPNGHSTPQASLPNPPLQDFLNNPEIDLDFMDTGGTWIDWQDVFWPEMDLPPA